MAATKSDQQQQQQQGQPQQSQKQQAQHQQQDQALVHAVYYGTSTSPIKDDVAALAACWKTGAGALTKQEAGLLLWYHCQRGEDGCAEVLGAGVLAPCLDVLGSPSTLAADKSTAAGLLHALSAHDATKEQVARSKASGAAGSSCCQVLHACLANAEAAPRHAVAVLASLASYAPSFSVLLKALAGEVPWRLYAGLLAASHKVAKDHATAIAVSNLCQRLVTGREGLAREAAASGLLAALLECMRCHKSATAVSAAASCLQAMCQAAPDLGSTLGALPGAMQHNVDVLGPPPAAIISWEQEQVKLLQAAAALSSPAGAGPPSPAAPAAAAAGASGNEPPLLQPQRQAWHHTSSSVRGVSCSGSSSNGAASNNSQHVRVSELRAADSSRARGSPRTSGSLVGAAASEAGDVEGGESSSAKVLQASESNVTRSRRKSLRILDVSEGEAALLQGSSGEHGSPTLRSKSTLGCARQGAVPPSKGAMRAATSGSASSSSSSSNSTAPALSQPILSANSTALKWGGPVPDATRTAVAGLLAELVVQPQLREAASGRLAASRLAALLLAALKALEQAAAAKKRGKKAAPQLTVPPEAQVLLTSLCVCLEFLVAGRNTDCFRVAAPGCLPGLVRLATDSRSTRLRRAAQAIVRQVALLSEVQHWVLQADVPEELLVLPEGTPVLLKLTGEEVRQLLVEFPALGGSGLQCLDDVTARARPSV